MNNQEDVVLEFFKSFIEKFEKDNGELKREFKEEFKSINTKLSDIEKELAVRSAVENHHDIPKLSSKVDGLEKKIETMDAVQKNDNSNTRIRSLEHWRYYLSGGLAVVTFLAGYALSQVV